MADFLTSPTTTTTTTTSTTSAAATTWLNLVCVCLLRLWWWNGVFRSAPFEGQAMYKVFTSLWSKPALPTSALNKTRLSSTTSSDSLSIDEDSWVFVNDTGESNDIHRCLLLVFSLQLWCRKSLHRFCLVITIWAIVLWRPVGLHHLLSSEPIIRPRWTTDQRRQRHIILIRSRIFWLSMRVRTRRGASNRFDLMHVCTFRYECLRADCLANTN